jgi:hypothetical protein
MDYKEYYANKEVLFEIVKQMQGREVALLGEQYNVRCIKTHSIAYLESNFKAFSFFVRRYNIYISSAHYHNMPTFSYFPSTRREQSKDFNLNFSNFMVGYDFFIDIDGDPQKIDDALSEARKIKMVFDEYKVPYSVKLSGKGFHFVIPSEFFSGILPDVKARNQVFKKLYIALKNLLDLKLADSTVYDARRVYKVAYSLDVKTGRVALPLTDWQIEHFHMDMVKPELVLAQGIRNRGLLTRNIENGELGLKKMIGDLLE